MDQLGLFAKFWHPGTVKTRLAARVGDPLACTIYRAFVDHLLNRLAKTAQSRSIVYSPVDSEAEFRAAVPGDAWHFTPQSAGDLGRRMQAFFEQCFAGHPLTGEAAQKVVVIGADSPQLNESIVQTAFDLLDDADVVVGPSFDGGYYLIGMRHQCYDLFSNITWSTDRVFEQTIERLNELKIPFETLPPLADIDQWEDLVSLRRDLELQRQQAQLDDLDIVLLERIQDAARMVPSPDTRLDP